MTANDTVFRKGDIVQVYPEGKKTFLGSVFERLGKDKYIIIDLTDGTTKPIYYNELEDCYMNVFDLQD